jgi:outer membrane receptor for ferrienterochelin and colicins
MRFILLLLVFSSSFSAFSQSEKAAIQGYVSSDGLPVEYVTVQVEGTKKGSVTGSDGRFIIEEVSIGNHILWFKSIGYVDAREEVLLSRVNEVIHVEVELDPSQYMLNQMVITGTKTFKRQTDSPVIVNVLDSKMLDNVQACNLSEALKFQTGLRVETDCQTCNYTQLRMNGLGGGYSQILINGRPIFSPLTGLYGMEQIPVNMIDRIETIRGGGSSLYGSSAIGGTVNVITKIPRESSYNISSTYQSIKGETGDFIFSGNANILAKNKNSGISIFVNNRKRGAYDHNGDNFSELPSLKNNSFGSNIFFRPKENHKLEISLGSLSEYRYGGEMIDKAPHLAQQSEERRHDIYLASADYQINFNEENSSVISYLSGQSTERDHYTGIFPDDSVSIQMHIEAPPYGTSISSTWQAGLQLNHRLRKFISGSNVITLGAEYVVDEVYDAIPAYHYLVDQRTENLGVFVQSDWEFSPSLNLLSGLRFDDHNFLDKMVLSPRVSLLYKLKKETQFRMTYSTGFRAPQAFDADLHIAFAGGGVSRVYLSPDLAAERSRSYSASINYDKPTERIIYGFTVEGFYTELNGAFYQEAVGGDEFGELFEKRNGSKATVQGLSLEARANFDRKVQIETGFTLQTSLFESPVENVEGLPAVDQFLRTPNEYGYLSASLLSNKKFNANLNLVYTGEMLLSHFAGAPEQEVNAYVTTSAFTELGFKLSYTLDFDTNTQLEFLVGIKNVLDSYQDDFDSGKNRDSNYVYGTASPRTYFVGFRLSP